MACATIKPGATTAASPEQRPAHGSRACASLSQPVVQPWQRKLWTALSWRAWVGRCSIRRVGRADRWRRARGPGRGARLATPRAARAPSRADLAGNLEHLPRPARRWPARALAVTAPALSPAGVGRGLVFATRAEPAPYVSPGPLGHVLRGAARTI